MNNEVKSGISNVVITVVFCVLLFGCGYFCNVFRTKEIDGLYRAELEKQRQQRIELEQRNKQLEAENQQLANDMERQRVELSSAIANMEQTAGAIGNNNSDALRAITELRDVQKQIQNLLLDSGSGNGGIDSGANS